MKSKQDILAFLKWVIVPLLFGGLQACRLAPPSPQSVSPAISHTNASEPTASREVAPPAITPSIGTISTNTLSHIEAPEPAASGQVTPPAITPSTGTTSANTIPAASVAADTGVDPQEIKDPQEFKNRLTQLEEKERENHTLVLEGQRKTICWWFVFLAVLTAVLVVFGALVPFLRGRKDKELIQQMLTEARAAVHIIKEHHAAAGRTVEEIKHQLDEARKIAENFRSDEVTGGVDVQKTKEAVAAIQQDPEADFKLKLRAEAIAASQDGKAEKAYALWHALAELDPDDSSAQFNTGHWAHCLGEKSRGGDGLGRLRQACRHYQQALTIKPDKHEAAYNWGLALANEAQALAASDVAVARTLWQQAGEKYQQALAIKADMHEAALNWGNALDDEAQALAASDLTAARALWQQAGEKYQQALAIKADMHEAALNWGNALDDEAQAVAASDVAAARTLWQRAGEKYQQALTIKPDKHEAAYNWGLALANEAQAVAASDLPAARALWQRAGEKYQQALTIKPDKHEAALNWGVVLANEAQALAASDLAAARGLWQQAGEKYQQALTIKPDKYDAALNWGVALANEAQAMAASDLPAARALWQQAGEKYQQALTIKPDDESAHFGSAGVWALLGQVQECCSSLARWRKCKLDAKRSDLDASPDFDSVRNIPEFQAFRESLPE
jgi:hypothetical protein